MERITQVARETGYLDGIRDFRSVDVFGYLPPGQGRGFVHRQPGRGARGAIAHCRGRSSRGELLCGDRVIFSSRAIPGNEKAVSG